jgi:hypothetical protein
MCSGEVTRSHSCDLTSLLWAKKITEILERQRFSFLLLPSDTPRNHLDLCSKAARRSSWRRVLIQELKKPSRVYLEIHSHSMCEDQIFMRYHPTEFRENFPLVPNWINTGYENLIKYYKGDRNKVILIAKSPDSIIEAESNKIPSLYISFPDYEIPQKDLLEIFVNSITFN